MPISQDFRELILSATKRSDADEYDGPPYVLFVFDPMTGEATIEDNAGHPAQAKTHGDLRSDVTHPGRIDGYAYKIKRGWRITDDDHKKIEDHFVVTQVLKALREKFPAKPLPRIANSDE